MLQISRCPYCKEVVTNPTREHLIPVSMNGVGIIHVCYTCNMARGNSLSYLPFFHFVKNDPELYIVHVESSKNSDDVKKLLRTLPECISSEEVEHLESAVMKKLTNEDQLRKEAMRQKHALNMSRKGTPITGGRADKARKRSHRAKIVKKNRTRMRNACRQLLKLNF